MREREKARERKKERESNIGRDRRRMGQRGGDEETRTRKTQPAIGMVKGWNGRTIEPDITTVQGTTGLKAQVTFMALPIVQWYRGPWLGEDDGVRGNQGNSPTERFCSSRPKQGNVRTDGRGSTQLAYGAELQTVRVACLSE